MKKETITKTYHIYGLVDPTDKKIKYIGCSTNVEDRYRQHIYNSKYSNDDKYEWINGLRKQNLYPETIILDTISTNDRKMAINMESKWIEKYKNDLFNMNQTNSSKKVVSLKISEKLWNQFQLTTNAMNQGLSEVVEDLLRTYCITNKVALDESIKKFWELNEQ